MTDSPAVIVVGACFGCGRLFGFHPLHVPSYDPSQDDPTKPAGRQPICRDCIDMANERRWAAGLPLWEVHPKAYEPDTPEVLGP